MRTQRLTAYLEGWSRICSSTPESVDSMVANAHPEIRFSDVNSSNIRIGHEGIRTICALATHIYSDAAISWDDVLSDGHRWSIRWTFSGTRNDGTSFLCRGASAGMLADDGTVIEHTDYWSRDRLGAGQ